MALYAFNGTWNEDEKDEGKDSNVVKFFDAYTEGRKFQLDGVGTRLGFIGKLLGGVAGAGGRAQRPSRAERGGVGLRDPLRSRYPCLPTA